jgi:AraC-like DNA-binding protein
MSAPQAELPTPLHKWASLRTELMWVYKGLVAPDNRRVTTDHRFGYWLWLLTAGQVNVRMGDKSWTAKAGQWIISPQGKTVQEFSADARILSLHFRCQWPTGENLFTGNEAVVIESKKFPLLERSAAALQQLVHRHFPRIRSNFSLQSGDLPIFLRLQQLFFQLLLEFYEVMARHQRFPSRAGSSDDRLLRAIRVLHESPIDEPFPAAQLQKETGLGRAHLDRLYWREYGITTRVYWERLREESAVRSLESTRLSIKEIGYRLGFRQASHFTKWFRHRLELTPTEYRTHALRNRELGDEPPGVPLGLDPAERPRLEEVTRKAV